MTAWLRRFALHLAAAVGATGVLVAAVAVGASQSRPPSATAPQTSVTVASTSPRAGRLAATATPGAARVVPERSLAGTVVSLRADEIDVLGVGGREWHIVPAPGALIRLNGHAVKLDGLQAGDRVVILGQAQSASGDRLGFLAHAITARRKS